MKPIKTETEEMKNGIINFLDQAGFMFYAYEIEQGFITCQHALRLAQEIEYVFPDEAWVAASHVWLDRAEYLEI